MNVEMKNAEGYMDPTAYEAIKKVERRGHPYRPVIYVCSPYAGDTAGNTDRAKKFSRFVVDNGGIPLTPHLLLPQFMKEAVSRIAAPAIRNAGTFGGNLGNGSAKADSVLVEYATGAKICVASVRGERVVPVERFYKGRKELDLAPDELILEVLLPKLGIDDYYYHKVGGRQALAISRVSFGGLLSVEDGVITRFTCAFGAVSGTVLRYPDLEAQLVGRTVEEARGASEKVIASYAERMQLTRGRVSAEYRKDVCLNLLGDFLASKGI